MSTLISSPDFWKAVGAVVLLLLAYHFLIAKNNDNE